MLAHLGNFIYNETRLSKGVCRYESDYPPKARADLRNACVLLYLQKNLEIMIRLLGAIDSEAGDELAFYREHEGLHRKYVAAFREKAVLMNILTSFSVICKRLSDYDTAVFNG